MKNKLYNIQVREGRRMAVYPIGATSEQEAIEKLVKQGFKRAYIIGKE